MGVKTTSIMAWACSTCTYVHEGPAAAFMACEVCETARGNAPSEAGQQGDPVDLQGGESTEESDDEMPELPAAAALSTAEVNGVDDPFSLSESRLFQSVVCKTSESGEAFVGY